MDYLITPSDVLRWARNFLIAVFSLGRTDWLKVLLIVIGYYLSLRFGDATLETRIFLVLALATWFFRWDARVPIGGALFGLILIPLTMILGKYSIYIDGEGLSERIAVWVYYLLVIGVVRQMMEIRQDETDQITLAPPVEVAETPSVLPYALIPVHSFTVRRKYRIPLPRHERIVDAVIPPRLLGRPRSIPVRRTPGIRIFTRDQ